MVKHKRTALGRHLALLRRQVLAALYRLMHAFQRQTKTETEPENLKHPVLPTGPYQVRDTAGIGNLLLYVPRNLEGRLIDELTGRYGYSHLAIDCGEIDLPTGKRVLVETTQTNVHRGFQDEYGPRAHVRLPLAPHGVDCAAFCDRVRAKIGETYDYEEALTRGLIDNPAKQICSDLATVCLPDALREDIARAAKARALRRFSVSVHRHAKGGLELFVSPNGYAEYFGAPRGQELSPEPAPPTDNRPVEQALPAEQPGARESEPG